MITNDIFLSHLNCRRKAYLKAAGHAGEPTDLEMIELGLERAYRDQALAAYLGPGGQADVVRDPPYLEVALQGRPRVIVNATANAEGVSSQIHALERAAEAGPAYAPVLFARSENVSRSDKLLLAFNGLALSAVQGKLPSVARIVHGAGHKVVRVKVAPLLGEVRKLVAETRASQAEGGPPRLTLNGHCNVCEFRTACRRVAEEADDLSLLRGMSQKKIEKHRKRGIVTVTQFSHTYQPGRRGKRRAGKARKHDHALQALAVREKKVYVLDGPSVPRGGVAVYLDIEGLPDQSFDYLIGLVAVGEGVCTAYSFWADDWTQEKAIWADCVRTIEGLGDYTLYHYGRYESRFLDRMRRSAGSEEEATIDRIRARSCNVLAAIHSHVYFPTWSNGLKDIGTFLGALWSAPNASGIQSMAWRLAWESSHDGAVKQRLLAYNREDCLALRRVTEFILSVCDGGAATAGDRPARLRQDDRRPPVGRASGRPPPGWVLYPGTPRAGYPRRLRGSRPGVGTACRPRPHTFPIQAPRRPLRRRGGGLGPGR
jgi:predicted RecB family nuclease